MSEVEVVTDAERAEVLLNPLRLKVLEAAREPASTAEIARRLGLKPQKVNYHVRRLLKAGFLRKVEERRERNLVERVYAATAASYLVAADVMGQLSPARALTDPGASSRWLALLAKAQGELGETLREPPSPDGDANVAGDPGDAFSMESELRFHSAEQRALFERALRELVGAIVGKYAAPAAAGEGQGDPPPGRPYRLVLGCHAQPGWVEPEAPAEPAGG